MAKQQSRHEIKICYPVVAACRAVCVMAKHMYMQCMQMHTIGIRAPCFLASCVAVTNDANDSECSETCVRERERALTMAMYLTVTDSSLSPVATESECLLLSVIRARKATAKCSRLAAAVASGCFSWSCRHHFTDT